MRLFGRSRECALAVCCRRNGQSAGLIRGLARFKGIENFVAILGQLIDFGLQPLTNRWPISATSAEYQFRLLLGQCGACGVVQLVDPPPPEEIRSHYDWLSYNEPEGHQESRW